MKGYKDGTYPVRVDSTIYGLANPLYLRVKLAPVASQSSDPSKAPLVTLAGVGEEHYGTLESIEFYADTSGNRNGDGNWTVRLANAPGSTSFIASGAIAQCANMYPAASGKVSSTPAGRPIAVAINAVTADLSEVEGLVIPPGGKQVLTRNYNASSVDEYVFIADRPYEVVGIKQLGSVAGSDGSAVTLDVRKITAAGTDLPGAAAGTTVKELLTAAFDLKATAGTVVAGTLTATAADRKLAIGDKLAFNFIGTMTAAVGNIAIELIPVNNL